MRRPRLLRRALGLALGIALAWMALSGPAGAAPSWIVVELRPLPGLEGEQTFAAEVTNAGVSVGRSGGLPVRWDRNGNPTALPLPAGTTSGQAVAATEWGLIVGRAGDLGVAWYGGAVVWTWPGLHINDVNERGVVAGFTGGSTTQAAAIGVLGQAPHTLPSTGTSSALALNDSGVVVGRDGTTQAPKATAWYLSERIDLSNGAPEWSGATDITNSGLILVHSSVEVRDEEGNIGSLESAWIASPAGVAPIGADHTYLAVAGITEGGLAAGLVGVDVFHDLTSVLWVYGQEIPLGSLVGAADADRLDEPEGINDRLWIVGADSDAPHAWLVRPRG